ncbi:hypothetical protein C0995_003201 [Termitomyces sp. Mi166|nr:hypothetical protein C0995_003201 [Termitomyces sp. Mi166\
MFPHRKALYRDIQGMESEIQQEDECEDSESPDKAIEVGDRIYATTLHPSPMATEIWASQTTSQHLAQAFAANFQPKPLHSTVSHHLQDFEDVFFKALFNSLPEHKQWDHAIELVLDAEPSS